MCTCLEPAITVGSCLQPRGTACLSTHDNPFCKPTISSLQQRTPRRLMLRPCSMPRPSQGGNLGASAALNPKRCEVGWRASRRCGVGVVFRRTTTLCRPTFPHDSHLLDLPRDKEPHTARKIKVCGSDHARITTPTQSAAPFRRNSHPHACCGIPPTMNGGYAKSCPTRRKTNSL